MLEAIAGFHTAAPVTAHRIVTGYQGTVDCDVIPKLRKVDIAGKIAVTPC